MSLPTEAGSTTPIELSDLVGTKVTLVNSVLMESQGHTEPHRKEGVVVRTPEGDPRATYGIACRESFIDGTPCIGYTNIDDGQAFAISKNSGDTRIHVSDIQGGGTYDTVYPELVGEVKAMLECNGL